MQNIPTVKMGIIAVSRDCFPIELSQKRRSNVYKACKDSGIDLIELKTTVENEEDALNAIKEAKDLKINSLVIFLGNFGPEGPLSILAQKFEGPVMFCAAAEEAASGLLDGRGDAYCGMLNASISASLRQIRPYIPEYPVGTAQEIANMIKEFYPVARVILGVSNLKVFSFGPRPHNFYACNAPIKALFDLGIEIMENSELDLYDIYNKAAGDPRIKTIKSEMESELKTGNNYPDLLEKLAQYEVALMDFYNNNLGASKYGVFANKCWPAFESYFGFVPCYVNSRLATRGIPVACEVDIYGAVTEYMITCATMTPATLLDINNSVPVDMFDANKKIVKDYTINDLFMGFHCGNTSSECMGNCEIKFQKIMHSLLEPGKEPDITRGTLEGSIRPGDVTIFRLQSTADTKLRAYVANGEILNIDPQSFGSIAVFAIKEMGRFYRHVLIAKQFPHHAGVAFGHTGKALFSATKLLGVDEIDFNRPAGMLYKDENPF
ncbi:MAG: fucose isomerase [Spirochaetes bacterium]|nr:fucose isomerase [Spirochaetota bacterium]MBN2771696.1 fucose isomerase [Spirochaetota bacterium]